MKCCAQLDPAAQGRTCCAMLCSCAQGIASTQSVHLGLRRTAAELASGAAGRQLRTSGAATLAGASGSQLARDLACLIRQVQPASTQEAAALEALAQGIAEEDATAVRTLAAILSDAGEWTTSGEQHQQAGLQEESGMQAALSLVSRVLGLMLCALALIPPSAASRMLLTHECAARAGAMVVVKAGGSIAICVALCRRGQQ